MFYPLNKILVIGPESTMEKELFYDGSNPMMYLIDTLNIWAEEVLEKIQRNDERVMTQFEAEQHFLSDVCSLCFREYWEKNPKVFPNYKNILNLCIF